MDLDFRLYRDLRLDVDVTQFWENHQWHPHSDLEYVRHEYQGGPEDRAPYIAAISNRRDIVSCVIGEIESLPLTLQFGYKTIHGPVLSTLVLHRRSFVGNWQYSTYSFLMDHLLSLLSTGTIDILKIREIPLDSPLHDIASAKVPFLRRDHFPIVQEYWLINQLHSFETFLRSHRNARRNLKKCHSHIRSMIGGKVRIECYRHLHEIEAMLQHSERVDGRTWQRKLNDFSFLDEKVRATYEFYLGKGWSRAFVLYVDDNPAAFFHGILYKGVFYAERKGYDPAYRSLSLGTYLLMKAIEELCGESNTSSIEFGVGNSEDKMRYCDSAFRVADIHLFGPGLRLWPLNILRLTAQGSHQLAKQVLHKLGYYHSFRKRSRFGSFPAG